MQAVEAAPVEDPLEIFKRDHKHASIQDLPKHLTQFVQLFLDKCIQPGFKVTPEITDIGVKLTRKLENLNKNFLLSSDPEKRKLASEVSDLINDTLIACKTRAKL